MSKHRLGIAIGVNSVRAVLLVRNTVVWEYREPIPNGDEGLNTAFDSVLRNVPRQWYRRVRAIVALSPACAHYRALAGAPDDATALTLTLAIHANAARFFPVDPELFEFSDAHRNTTTGGWWMGAVDARLCKMVSAACRKHKIVFGGCVAAVAALPLSLESEFTIWCDGQYAMEIRSGSGQVLSITPLRMPGLADKLKGVVDAENSYADSIGAARLSLKEPSIVNPEGIRMRQRRVILRRTLIAAAIVISAFVSAFTYDIRILAKVLAVGSGIDELRARATGPATDLRTIIDVRVAAESLAAFTDSQRSASSFLIELSDILPSGSAIVALRVDQQGASIVVLTPAGEPILPALAQIGGVSTVQHVGAVTRENLGERAVQRTAAVLAFEKSESPMRSRTPEGR